MKNKILFIGDSHIFHCFANGTVDVYYIIDVTLNKIRKFDSNLFVSHLGYSPNEYMHKYEMVDSHESESMIDIINNSPYEYVLINIGEIDIRQHSQKLKDESIFINTISTYEKFLNKITKKVILMSITPPGLTRENNIDTFNDRISLTREMNKNIVEVCKRNNYYYFDIFSDFQIDGILDSKKSDGGVHISKNYQSYILEKLNTKIDEFNKK